MFDINNFKNIVTLIIDSLRAPLDHKLRMKEIDFDNKNNIIKEYNTTYSKYYTKLNYYFVYIATPLINYNKTPEEIENDFYDIESNYSSAVSQLNIYFEDERAKENLKLMKNMQNEIIGTFRYKNNIEKSHYLDESKYNDRLSKVQIDIKEVLEKIESNHENIEKFLKNKV